MLVWKKWIQWNETMCTFVYMYVYTFFLLKRVFKKQEMLCTALLIKVYMYISIYLYNFNDFEWSPSSTFSTVNTIF